MSVELMIGFGNFGACEASDQLVQAKLLYIKLVKYTHLGVKEEDNILAFVVTQRHFADFTIDDGCNRAKITSSFP